MIELDGFGTGLIMSFLPAGLASTMVDIDPLAAISDVRGFGQGGAVRFLLVAYKVYAGALPISPNAWPGAIGVTRTKLKLFRHTTAASPTVTTTDPGLFCGNNYIEGCTACSQSATDLCQECTAKSGNQLISQLNFFSKRKYFFHFLIFY